MPTGNGQTAALDQINNKVFYYGECRYPREEDLPRLYGIGEIAFEQRAGSFLQDNGFSSSTPLDGVSKTTKRSARYRRAGKDEIRDVRGGQVARRRAAIARLLEQRAGLVW